MNKLNKFYTPIELAKKLINITYEVIGKDNITEIIEPSAGSGNFSHQIENCIAYDIEPEADDIIKQDFLQLNINYKKGRLFIGNPPFGNRTQLYRKFYKKCCELGDYIAFILPMGQYKYSTLLYEFDLIYTTKLNSVRFSNNLDLRCCFNIYKRPENGLLNKKPNYDLQDVKIIDKRRYDTRPIEQGYDFAFCAWGEGSLGKRLEKPRTYAKEFYVYVKNKNYLKQIDELLSRENLVKEFESSTSFSISILQLYKYIKDNIKNIK